jgi:hypothetical protein
MTGKILRDRSSVALDRHEASINLMPQYHHISLDRAAYRKGLSFNGTTSVITTKSQRDMNIAKNPVVSSIEAKRTPSFGSTANQYFDLDINIDYNISLNDFDGTSESSFRSKSAKRRKQRNRKLSRINKKSSSDYFDLILTNCDSDVSTISMDDIDWIADFEQLDIDHSNEEQKTDHGVMVEKVTLMSSMNTSCLVALPILEDTTHSSGKRCESLITRSDSVRLLGRRKELLSFFNDAERRDSLIDTLTMSSEWRRHTNLLDDWRKFMEELQQYKYK